MQFGTKAIHAGVEPDPSTGAVMTPIFQTSTYVQSSPGQHKGFEYARTQNPTRQVLEANLAALENGAGAVCFGSGLAAMDAVLKLLKSGDEVLAVNDLYGGSYRLLVKVYEKFGIASRFIDMQDPEEVEKAIGANTRLLWIETPTNPMLNLVDIEALCAVAKKKGLMVCVDNTFASPYLQCPIDLGADLVLHSATNTWVATATWCWVQWWLPRMICWGICASFKMPQGPFPGLKIVFWYSEESKPCTSGCKELAKTP
jgi:cystathionine gamma-lyase